MATNFVHEGDVLTLTAPSGGVSSGDLVTIGSILGVALADAAAGASVSIRVTGVWKLPKASGQAWSEGVTLYWDATAKNATTSSGGGANAKLGVAAEAAASADTTGTVRLVPTI